APRISVRKSKVRSPGGVGGAAHTPGVTAAPPTRSASAQRGLETPGLSHLGRRLMSATPALPVGVSRRFRAMACVHAGAWPNEERYGFWGQSSRAVEPPPDSLGPNWG